MSSNKMLIDATHPEETRVVVLRDGRVEEFDYESAARKLLRGNIYLAKVTRVEPSLQAAFVDYGGNRHGFLAFNEIHPDYYQIPMADRLALLEEEAAAEAAEEAAADAHAERMARRRQRQAPGGPGGQRRDGRRRGEASREEEGDEDRGYTDAGDSEGELPSDGARTVLAEHVHGADDLIVEDLPEPEVVGGFEPPHDGDHDNDHDHDDDHDDSDDEPEDADGDVDPGDLETEDQVSEAGAAEADAPHPIGLVEDEAVEIIASPSSDAETVEQTGAEDALEELPSRPRRRPRSYKIQEVIKRRQVILVQVVKEERGNKGAALTTYLSLAGRYTVLMPNTARGGGISRKITNPQDRKRLKAIASELDVPEGMGLIIRTAGAARTKQEIKRDYEYLLRLWESVRDLTLQSTAPSLVYEEGNLIKRSIRDLYNKDVEEIVVAGEPAHQDAREFMRMLMPSHAKNVILHATPEPLFNKYGIERQLNAMFSPFVNLKSGGYLVVNQTEALVAIDVNSGKSTREFSIEETAYNTNLEAADEIARQLKLRDLAGLIVIDFIDMEEKRNNRSVERRLKDALRFDRARIQLGRISHFGLMEMSRQRLRTGVLEGSTSQCPHCQGTGIIRSTESVALAVLRGIEDALMAGPPSPLVATTTAQVALYILNNKRRFITDLEAHHGITISVQASDKLQGANFTVEKTHARTETPRRPERSVVNMDWGFEGEDETVEPADEGRTESVRFVDSGEEEDETGGERRPSGAREERGPRRRRRRGRRGGEREGRGDGRGEGRGERQAHAPGPGPHRSPRDEEPRETFADARGGPHDEADDDAEIIEILGEDGAEVRDEGRRAGPQGADGDRGEDRGARRRRRGRRGGRRGRARDRDTDRETDRDAGGVSATDADTGETNGYPIRPHVTEDVVDDFAGGTSPDIEPEAEPVVEPDTRPAPAPIRAPRPSRAATQRRDKPMAAAPETAAEVIEPEAAPAETRPRHGEPIASEPRIERVVVTPDQGVAATEAAEQPTRRGWWQRRIGGE